MFVGVVVRLVLARLACVSRMQMALLPPLLHSSTSPAKLKIEAPVSALHLVEVKLVVWLSARRCGSSLQQGRYSVFVFQ
jgi:hypothetical protein